MSEYTLPPTITGVPPETWEQILQILNQFGVTVWDLTQQGITTWEGAGGLKEYLLNHGWELKEVWDLKYMWFQTGAGDATQSNALVQYVANEVTIGGTAGAEYVKHFTYGETTLGKLKKGIIFGSIFALLVSSLDPSFITDTLKGRLNAVIDRFADENDDVPVILDANGKIYYHEDMIDALRQELIDAGVYDSGDPVIPPTIDSSYNINGYDTANNVQNITILPSIYNAYAPYINHGSRFIYSDNTTATYFHFGSSSTGVSYNFIDSYTIWFKQGASTTYSCVTIYELEDVSDSAVYGLTTGTGYNANNVFKFSKSGNIMYKYRYGDKIRYFLEVNSVSQNEASYVRNGSPSFIQVSSAPDFKDIIGIIMNEQGGSGGIEGITVSDDLISRGIGNAQTALEDIFPSYDSDKVTTINPSDEDITASENWYPISTYDNDVWEDGITEQQSETATDGEVTPDIQTQIADAIKEILEDYYRDPTDPTIINWPQIPVGDSGDTPPENPDLISGSSNGLWAIYNPSISEVQQFGAWLWSDSILDQITRMFNSPIDAVIGFHMIYCTPVTGSSKTIKAGYLDSNVSAKEVTNQYKDIDCGTVTISEYYRNALDYDNTRISLFLPFIGIVPLDTNTVMGSQLSILYRVDVLTGTCLAQVKVIKENSEAVLYTFQGNCSVQVPLTATTYTGMVGALLSGISAGASIMTGNIVGAVSAGLEGAMRAGTGLSGVRQSGTIGANAGALGIRIPYVIITHPVSAMSDGFNTLEGLPSNELVNLSSVSGFTRVTFVHLENIPASMPEIEEIKTLLETGVIF